MKDKCFINALIQPVGWVVLALLGVGGCQPDTATKAEIRAAEKPAVPAPAPPAVAGGGGPSCGGYHRYRGTVGGQPVTVELTIGPETKNSPRIICEGSYSYDRHPAGRLLLSGPRPFLAQRPLGLAETETARHQPTGRWQAGQPVGPLLTGTWTSPTGQLLPFRLHEDYTDGQGYVVAVQYELLQEGEEVPCEPERKEGESKAAYRARTKDLTGHCNEFFLHLLGPDTLRLALRALQCPVPAQRRRQMREQAGGCNQGERQLRVIYNGYGLLSLERFVEDFYEGADHPGHALSTTTYDLRTGQPLAITALLRPGTDTILTRLIARHLGNVDEENSALDELLNSPATASASAPLLQLGLGIGDDGLAFTYSNYYDSLTPPVTVEVPYPKLLPLLRPNSPVARMLRERGLWRTAKK